MNLEERKNEFVKLVCDEFTVFDGTDMWARVCDDRIILETRHPNGLLAKFGEVAEVRFFLFADSSSIIFSIDKKYGEQKEKIKEYFQSKWAYEKYRRLPDGRRADIQIITDKKMVLDFDIQDLFSLRGPTNSVECLLKNFIVALGELKFLLGIY